jgi:hypothetical protein
VSSSYKDAKLSKQICRYDFLEGLSVFSFYQISTIKKLVDKYGHKNLKEEMQRTPSCGGTA